MWIKTTPLKWQPNEHKTNQMPIKKGVLNQTPIKHWSNISIQMRIKTTPLKWQSNCNQLASNCIKLHQTIKHQSKLFAALIAVWCHLTGIWLEFDWHLTGIWLTKFGVTLKISWIPLGITLATLWSESNRLGVHLHACCSPWGLGIRGCDFWTT